jgi:hypothetical protein
MVEIAGAAVAIYIATAALFLAHAEIPYPHHIQRLEK